MQLNLNNFARISLASSHTSFVLSATDEALALQDYLIDLLLKDACFIKLQYFIEKGFNFDIVTNRLAECSLFDDKLVFILNFKTKPNAEHAKILLKLYSLLNENNKLIIATNKLDKKDLSQEWLNLSSASIQLTGDINEVGWLIDYYLKQFELQIERSAKQLLIDLTYGNITQLLQELKQLPYLYIADDVINYDDLVVNITDSSNYSVFGLSSVYLRGDVATAIKMLDSLYHDDSDLILIIWVISEDIRRLMQIKGALKNNNSLRSIAPSLRIWGGMLNDFEAANIRISYSLLVNLLDKLAQVDMLIKGLRKGSAIVEIKNIVTALAKGTIYVG